MKMLIILFLLLFCGFLMSCKTQCLLKQQLYVQVKSADSIMDNRILKSFSKLDPSADSLLTARLKAVALKSDEINNRKIRIDLQLYDELTRKVILLHQDPHINYEALGPLLETYTQTATKLYDKLNCRSK